MSVPSVVPGHISTAEHAPYVCIQVDAGLTSNVKPKPADISESLP